MTLKNNVGKPAELAQTIEVLSASVENKELSADPETMRRLAEISGEAVSHGGRGGAHGGGHPALSGKPGGS